MRSGASGRPVFVAGAPRSGIGILTWSLAQHPSFEVVPGSGWIGRLSMQLAGTYAAGRDEGRWIGHPASVTSPDAFLGAFGPAVEATLGLPPLRPTARGDRDDEEGADGRRSRWISGSADHSLHIYGLSRLFPEARFIHVVREASAVVRSLVHVATPDGAYYTERSAVETWLRCVKACFEAERALGAGRILRVHHEELTREPKRLLLRCLAFLEEPFDPVCLRPLRGIESPAHEEPESRVDDGWLREDPDHAEVLQLWARLGSDPQRRDPDPAALARLEEASLAMGGSPDPSLRPASSADRIREFARAALPEGARVLVISRGDPDLVRIPGREAQHFPQADGGVYAGHHPGSSREAVEHLEALREKGAEFLLIPCTAYWWLDHYGGLREHLERTGREVARHEDACLVFALGVTAAKSGAGSEPMQEKQR
jgi:hypothetical protein